MVVKGVTNRPPTRTSNNLKSKNVQPLKRLIVGTAPKKLIRDNKKENKAALTEKWRLMKKLAMEGNASEELLANIDKVSRQLTALDDEEMRNQAEKEAFDDIDLPKVPTDDYEHEEDKDVDDFEKFIEQRGQKRLQADDGGQLRKFAADNEDGGESLIAHATHAPVKKQEEIQREGEEEGGEEGEGETDASYMEQLEARMNENEARAEARAEAQQAQFEAAAQEKQMEAKLAAEKRMIEVETNAKIAASQTQMALTLAIAKAAPIPAPILAPVAPIVAPQMITPAPPAVVKDEDPDLFEVEPPPPGPPPPIVDLTEEPQLPLTVAHIPPINPILIPDVQPVLPPSIVQPVLPLPIVQPAPPQFTPAVPVQLPHPTTRFAQAVMRPGVNIDGPDFAPISGKRGAEDDGNQSAFRDFQEDANVTTEDLRFLQVRLNVLQDRLDYDNSLDDRLKEQLAKDLAQMKYNTQVVNVALMEQRELINQNARNVNAPNIPPLTPHKLPNLRRNLFTDNTDMDDDDDEQSSRVGGGGEDGPPHDDRPGDDGGGGGPPYGPPYYRYYRRRMPDGTYRGGYRRNYYNGEEGPLQPPPITTETRKENFPEAIKFFQIIHEMMLSDFKEAQKISKDSLQEARDITEHAAKRPQK